jgi:hypothetical protein
MSDVTQLDDHLIEYIAAAEPCFDNFKRVAAQLAGLLILSASGSRHAGPDHPMVAVASDLNATAVDALKRLSPRGKRARHHHVHLEKASEKLAGVVEIIGSGHWSTERMTVPTAMLKSAWVELDYASRALPGFELVDLSQACCAQHANDIVMR